MRGVLIVDQSPSVARDIAAACNAAGLPVLGVARDGLEAVAMAQHARPSHIVLDLILPRLSGQQVMQTLARQGVTATVIVVSAVTARDPIMAARQGSDVRGHWSTSPAFVAGARLAFERFRGI